MEMSIRQLNEFIRMIDEWLEEPHSLSKDWVILLQYARQKFTEEADNKLKRLGGYDK